ncbi:MAG: RloB domain-containing protein, partial [Ignavibacteriae bacterium]|nr:RloB domain-containing protein [Ignavibacteriota bacterium]
MIICEGEKTEPLYFTGIKNDIRASALNIQISKRPKNSALQLVEEAIELKEIAKSENNEYDSIWIVIDKDSYSKFEETVSMAESNGINIAFSSISFEIWYLLHFKFTSKPWSKYSDIEKELLKYIPDYYKSNSDMYEKLKDKTSTAITNAKKLREHHKSDLES